MWTLLACISLPRLAPSSSLAPGKICSSTVAIRALSNDPQGCAATKTILLTGIRTAKRYPAALRRIHYFDAEKDLRLTFLTNNFLLPALTIAQLYRARRQVELFFRWIKQRLRIKGFYGTGDAVKTQVWVAVSVYVLVAIVKKQLGLDLSLYKILQILSVTVFERIPILEGFSNFSDEFSNAESCMQLNLFEF
jgi:hypothetical protein